MMALKASRNWNFQIVFAAGAILTPGRRTVEASFCSDAGDEGSF